MSAAGPALVIGGSRGLGRGMALALAEAGRPVVAVARTTPGPAAGTTPVTADATDPAVVAALLDDHDPGLVVVAAGAVPHVRPVQHHTWETFSRHWHGDVRIAFNVVRESLLRPLQPGARVVVVSSGAALAGSPLSGGYAGAKAAQLFLTRYAQDEARRAGLDLRFCAVLPRITPLTEVGRSAVRAYAARNGASEEDYLRGMGPVLTPEIAGRAVADLARRDDGDLAEGYLLTGAGLAPLPG